MSITLHAKLRDAGPLRLKDAAPIEPASAAPKLPVVAEPVAVEVRAMPALNVAMLPAPPSWVHTIRRDSNGQMVEVVSTPIGAAP